MPPPFRADHIGSLMRPQELIDVREGTLAPLQMHNANYNHVDSEQVRKIKETEKRTIADVVRKQVDRGITPITSGEFERPSFVAGFFESLDGIEIQFKQIAEFRTNHPIMRPYVEVGVPGRDQPVAIGKVRFKKSAYLAEFEYVKSLLPDHLWGEIKMTMPSPSWSHTQLKDGKAFTPEAYTDDEEYLKDIGKAMRQEILALYDAGCRFVQIDDPMFAMMVDDEYLAAQEAEGLNLDALLDPSIMVHNMVVQDLPSDLTIALHLCRGNIPKGMKAAVGGYHKMAIRMFQEMHYQRFALEWDNDLVTGDFTPLQHLPPGKLVVLGLVTTKIADMEDIAALKGQVMEAAGVIGKAQGRPQQEALDSLAVSPSCGFSSVGNFFGTGMNEQVQWQKLELIKTLAADIWGSPTKL